MGKSQRTPTTVRTSNIQSGFSMERQTSNWDICPPFLPNLMACPDKAHLQQSSLIGSPPPKSHIDTQWEDSDDKSIQMNLRIEVPEASRDNQNNYQLESAEGDITSKENTIQKDVTKLSNYLEDIRLQPIIVCENIADTENDSDIIEVHNESKRLSLSVPAIDVTDEKKRPPIGGVVSH